MDYEIELRAQMKILESKLSVLKMQLDSAELTVDRYEKLFTHACAKSNKFENMFNIAREALDHIAEHSFVPPASFVDVASDALYRMGQIEGEYIAKQAEKTHSEY